VVYIDFYFCKMNLSQLFTVLNFSSVLLSFAFDVFEYVHTFNFYSLLSMSFTIALCIVPFAMSDDLGSESKIWNVVFSRNFYFVPTCLFVLVFKGMAYGYSPIRGYTAISFWSFILSSYCGHYMKRSIQGDNKRLYETVPQNENKKTSWTMFELIKVLALTGCLVADRILYDSYTSEEYYMHTVFIVSLVCFAYLELVVFLVNWWLDLNKKDYQWVTIKPLQIVFSSLALGSASFSYASHFNHWHKLFTIIALFLIISAKHYFPTYKSV